jgi:hypothetical protein
MATDRPGQKLKEPLEQKLVGPHVRHYDPHPQYALATDSVSQADLDAAIAQEVLDRNAAIDAALTAEAPIQDIVAGDDIKVSKTGSTVTISLTPHRIIHPLDGAVLDTDIGELVWDVENFQQVVAA